MIRTNAKIAKQLKNKHMKKILLSLVAVAATSCQLLPEMPQVEKSMSTSSSSDEFIMGEVSHGLHKIQINDSTTVLLYRGVESCTMIQIK
jgi:hypothetical protein